MRTFLEWVGILIGGMLFLSGAYIWVALVLDTPHALLLLDGLAGVMSQVQWN